MADCAAPLRPTVRPGVLGLLLGPALAAAAVPPTDPGLDLEQLDYEGYRNHAYRSPTPASSAHAWTVSTAEAAELLGQGVIPVDVQAARLRPAAPGLPAAWLPSAPRLHIPGSVWLPNVGYPDLDPALDTWFRSHLQRLTGGDRDRALLIYCISDCWLAWNAVRRAASYGYTRLYWYPEGTDGWAGSGLPLVPAEPLPPPAGARPGAGGGF